MSSSYFAFGIGVCLILVAAWLAKHVSKEARDGVAGMFITSLVIAGLMFVVAGGVGATTEAHTSDTLTQLHNTDVAMRRLIGRE